MVNELGSEFWNIPIMDTPNHVFPEDASWFLSGRIALMHVIEDIRATRSIKTAALPSWCCETMIYPFTEAGIDVRFYPVFVEDGRLVQKPRDDCDVLLVMDYFGFSSSDDHSSSRSVVIRDVTHSLFSNQHADAQYYFGSLRKWTGIATGGFAWGAFCTGPPECGTDAVYVDLRRRAMREKAAYIAGRRSDKGFLSVFASAEERLGKVRHLCGASKKDIYLAKHLDADALCQRRRENAAVLLEALYDVAVFKGISDNDCPLFVPILIKDRDALSRHLIQNGIFCPAHWPLSPLHEVNEKEAQLYREELSVLCDQRYTPADMCRIVETIKTFGE